MTRDFMRSMAAAKVQTVKLGTHTLPRGRRNGTALERFVMAHAPLNDYRWRAMLAGALTEVTGDQWVAEP